MTARKPTLEERLPTYGKTVPPRTQAVMRGLRISALRFARDIEAVCTPGQHTDAALLAIEEAVALANKSLRAYGVYMQPSKITDFIERNPDE